jgi:hypothetical protein
MDVGIELSNGEYVIASPVLTGTAPNGTANAIDLQVLGSNLAPQIAAFGGSRTSEWIGLAPTATGGFSLYWQDPSSGVLYAQDYSSTLNSTGSTYTVSSPPPAALQAFTTTNAGGWSPVYLNDNGTAVIAHQQPSGPLIIEKTTASGAALPGYVINPTSGETFTDLMVAPTAETGGYVAAWVDEFSSGNYQLEFAQFSGSGQLEGRAEVSSGPTGELTGLELMGLPDGNFAIGFGYSWGPVHVDEYNAQGQELSVYEDNGVLQGMAALPDGRYEATYTRSSNGQLVTQVFTEKGVADGAADPAPQLAPAGHESLVPAISTTLASSSGWAEERGQAAVLSNGALALVDATANSYGWLHGAEQTYDANGVETASVTLLGGGATLAPKVTALPVGGFYEVTYGGSTNYEVYNANDQLVFVRNQYTSTTGGFAPLTNGAYVTTDSSSNVFGLFDANNNNVGWLSMPSDAPGAPTVNALNGGAFVFTYAGTSHFDLYDSSGDLLAHGDLSATGSQFATGFAALAGNGDGFLQAWLSPDGSTYNGIATSLDIQAVGPIGAISPVLTLTQDLDPWHTEFKLQAHADGSVAILWSEGGAVFGAEYANGAVGPAYSAGVLGGDLSHTVTVELPGDKEGFAWQENGHAWAEIFDPGTGQVLRADLGPASDSNIHAVATAQSGLAVSWHQYAYTGAVLDASGQVGALTNLYGEFLGVNAAGQAVTLHENGAGTPVLQTYTLNDGAFWVH